MRAKIACTNFLHGKFYWMNTRIVMKSKVEIEKSRLKVQNLYFLTNLFENWIIIMKCKAPMSSFFFE